MISGKSCPLILRCRKISDHGRPPMKILLFLLATFSIASAQTEPIVLMTTRTEGPPEPRLEVIALIDHGQFKNPNTYKDKGAFIRQYLPKGREFFVVFGGGAAGTLNLTSTG